MRILARPADPVINLEKRQEYTDFCWGKGAVDCRGLLCRVWKFPEQMECIGHPPNAMEAKKKKLPAFFGNVFRILFAPHLAKSGFYAVYCGPLRTPRDRYLGL